MTPPAHRTTPAHPGMLDLDQYTKAMLNILEDFSGEKALAEDTQRAMLNILEDFDVEKGRMEDNQRAMLNILEDFDVEKGRMGDTQRAMLNILDDFDIERTKAIATNRELKEAFDSLRRAKEAADAANKELEAFSYSVSHDLRAPLRHVQGFVELLSKQAGPVLDEKSQRYLKTITMSATKMGMLIDDLLSFSRMGRTEMHKTAVDLGRILDNVIKEMEDETKGRDITWKVGALPTVHADPAMLKLALYNLVANAVKFTRKSGNATIEVGAYEDGEEDVLFIRDNGVGFEMQYVDKLFGVFQRLHRADEFEGTGIGLANVRRIISRHGGRTWAESSQGGGAAFYVSLPKQVKGGQ